LIVVERAAAQHPVLGTGAAPQSVTGLSIDANCYFIVAFIQPPNSLPISTTIALTC
jgi:hypothetical protein